MLIAGYCFHCRSESLKKAVRKSLPMMNMPSVTKSMPPSWLVWCMLTAAGLKIVVMMSEVVFGDEV